MPEFAFDRATSDLIDAALSEDIGSGDITSLALLDPALQSVARFLAKEDLVIAGLPVVAEVFRRVDPAIVFTPLATDGDRVSLGSVFGEVHGPTRSLLTAERVALNFLQRLSGIASLTRRYVEAVSGLPVKILDTRKTTPGLRALEKYSVAMGGGTNHRIGLYDAVLIKDNHIDACGSIGGAVKQARERVPPNMKVEVEVRNLPELSDALDARPDVIMLDNMDLATMREAVHLSAGQIPLEASGNVSLENVRAIAETGVDFISVGSLTHSARAMDISMKITK